MQNMKDHSKKPKSAVRTRKQEVGHVENLIHELKYLIEHHSPLPAEEAIRGEIVVLESWLDSYRRGVQAIHDFPGKDMQWLHDLHDHLKLSAEEMQRLENESSNFANKEQAEKTEQLLKAALHLEKLMPEIDEISRCAATSHEAA